MRTRALIVTAVLVAIGAGAALASTPPPGTKTPKDRAAWRAILHWPQSCERDWKSTQNTSAAGVSLWPADRSGRRLVEVTCYYGAYQGVSMLYLLRSGPKVTGPVSLHIYSDTGNGKPVARWLTRILGILNFEPRTGRLVVFDKARGLGDCGFYSVFKLTGDRFVPTEAHAKTACDGKGPLDPSRWPKLPLLSP